MKTFVLSDVHGHYQVLKDALDEAGYDSDNPEHFLLCLGDLFDRGEENTQVYSYFYQLTQENKAEVLLGNHDLFMLEFLEGDFEGAAFNALHNGFNQTLEDFSGLNYHSHTLKKIHQQILKQYPNVKPWLKKRPLYLKTKDYIFAHGGLDGSKPDWHKEDKKRFVWQYQSRLEGLRDKTIVVGHERTAMMRLNRGEIATLNPGDPNQFTIIEEPGKIFIDGFVELSKHINVLKLDINAEEIKDASAR